MLEAAVADLFPYAKVHLLFFCRNAFYKNIKAEICEILRIFLEKFEKNIIVCWKFVNTK